MRGLRLSLVAGTMHGFYGKSKIHNQDAIISV